MLAEINLTIKTSKSEKTKLQFMKLGDVFNKQMILSSIVVNQGFSTLVLKNKEIPTHPGWQSLTFHFHCPAATSRASTSPLPVPSTSSELPAFLFFC